MPHRTVLIAGAGIAGPTLAHWLHRYGMTATVVERSATLRQGGQTVALRGAGSAVVEQMGLGPAVRAAATGQQGVAMVDAAGVTRAVLGAGAYDGEGPVTEPEILRGELAALLHQRTRVHTEYLFGDRITGVEEGADQVRVTFEHGPPREVDLVVAADGIGSSTRELVFSGTRIRRLGVYTAHLTIPRADSDRGGARCYHAARGRVVVLRPDHLGTTCAQLTLPAHPEGYHSRGVEAQKDLLLRTFTGAGWETPRVLEALPDATDLYFEAIGQVHAPRWSRGRVALLGDAGYCASPTTGMGTSLALVGAYVLAGELAALADQRDALAAYEAVLRPSVTRAQRLPPLAPRLAMPRTRPGIAALTTGLRVAARLPSGALGRRSAPAAAAGSFVLPDYSAHLVV